MYHRDLHQIKYNLQNYKMYTAHQEILRWAFLKKPPCTGDLSPLRKILIERPDSNGIKSYLNKLTLHYSDFKCATNSNL